MNARKRTQLIWSAALFIIGLAILTAHTKMIIDDFNEWNSFINWFSILVGLYAFLHGYIKGMITIQE